MSQSTIKLILFTILGLGLLSSLVSCSNSDATQAESDIYGTTSIDTTNRVWYYTAVNPLDYHRVVRIIYTPKLIGITNPLYDCEETVWVNLTSSAICNSHLDTHINCRRFDIIQALQ